MTCEGCSGSGACDPCDGYGTLPDSYPNAGDGADCGLCAADGVCIACRGTGINNDIATTYDTDSDSTNEFEDVNP
jgi:hypothetical protein